MAYDHTNTGVGFQCSGFSGKLNIDGRDYRIVFTGADDKAKFKFNVFVWSKDESYQTVIFDKDKKTENSPNYGGTLKLNDGKEYWLNVWHKKSEKGNYFLSASIKLKEDNSVMDKTSFADSMKNKEIDDEIPFDFSR